MGEVEVTLVGTVGQDPILRTGPKGDWATFRLASNPRWMRNGSWVDGPTSWFSVNANGELAHNVVASIAKGQQVIVRGTVSIRESDQQDGSKQVFVNVQADAVGPDLRWGTARFTRGERRATPGAPGQQQPLQTAPTQQPMQAPPQQAQQQPSSDQQGADWGGFSGGPAERPAQPVPQGAGPVPWGSGGLGVDEDTPF